MFNFFHKKYLKDETALVFSIESGEIVAAIVQFQTDKKPLVLYTKRTNIASESHGSDHLAPAMLYALKHSCETMIKGGFGEFNKLSKKMPIKNTYVFLGSVWHKSTTNTIAVQKEQPFLISDELLEKESENFFKSMNMEGFHIEKKIISVKANGYSMAEPIGKKVTSLELKAHVSIADPKLIEEIQNTIYMSFPNFRITFHTIALAVFTVANELLPDSDFLLIVPQCQITEFILVINDSIEGNASVPFGRHRMVEQISHEHDISRFEALSLLGSWKEGDLTKTKTKSIETIIMNARDEWHTYLKGAFGTIGQSILLPSQIYMLGHSLETELLSKWIMEEEYSQQAFLAEKFKLAYFSQKNTAELIDSNIPKEEIGAMISCLVLFVKSL